MGSEMFSVMCFKSDFLTRMNCIFWISGGFLRLVLWWQVVLGAGEEAVAPGLGSVWARGVLGAGCVAC